MEQPLRRNELDFSQPFEGDAGNVARKHPAVPKQAGHILLHEVPHNGEISLEQSPQQPQIDRVERSAWHAIAMSKDNKVIEQTMGAAFQQEQRPEQLAQSKLASHVIAAAQQQDSAATNQPVSPISTPSEPTQVPINPLYATMSGSQNVPGRAVPETSVPTVPTQPHAAGADSATASETQPINPIAAQPTQAPVNLSGAINPSFAQPSLPQMHSEPMLPAGDQIDVQHRLPAATSRLKLYLTSPWLWLALGIIMILYFASGLINS